MHCAMRKLEKSSLLLVLACLLGGSISGCSNLSYYAQAVGGHLGVMRNAVPISEMVKDPGGDPVLKKKLEDVQAIREFASRELGLPDNNSYRTYVDVGRSHVVWNVFAAPEFSLAPKIWCMLLVGCVNYRGYYDKEQAETFAAELRQEGFDTYVGGVAAYSTLGYFNDPVLSTFLRQSNTEVARVVFHELAHQLVFVAGDTQFNESYATAVENEGMRRWLRNDVNSQQRTSFEAQQQRRAGFAELIRTYRMKLQTSYGLTLSDDERRNTKAELLVALRRDYAALKTGWGGNPAYDKFVGDDLNNAKFASVSLYAELVPAFEALLAQENHQLPRFYQRVTALAALDKEARRQVLAEQLSIGSKLMVVAAGDR